MAQFGSALGSGPRGRGFESRHSDQKTRKSKGLPCFFDLQMGNEPRSFEVPKQEVRGEAPDSTAAGGGKKEDREARDGRSATDQGAIRQFRGRLAVGSNPVTPTKKTRKSKGRLLIRMIKAPQTRCFYLYYYLIIKKIPHISIITHRGNSRIAMIG